MSEPDVMTDPDLRDLPRYDLPKLSTERIRRLALKELTAPRRLRPPWARRAYRRAEPVLAGALAAAYLRWAFHVVLP